MNGLTIWLLLLWLIGAGPAAFADGKVFSRHEVRVKIEIPNQQALIHFADNIEDLVIETSFLGEGTNFAWVVPLPAAPEIEPVPVSFFPSLQQAFQPRLIHEVPRYYFGVLFFFGLFFLGWRSLKDEVPWASDLPVCLLLAAGVGIYGKNWLLGLIAFCCLLYARICIRSTANLTLVLVSGMVAAAGVALLSDGTGFGYITLMGSETGGRTDAGVDVVSVQRAGVFDSTTIRGSDPRAVMKWLEINGYDSPESVYPAIQRYVQDGWVFVASKVWCNNAAAALTSLHPLAFKFAARAPVYPLRLTAVDNGACAIDLYVFGDQRAATRHFRAARCDRVAQNVQLLPDDRRNSWLRAFDPDVLRRIGRATVGTKLSAKLSPAQMDADAEIKWGGFRTKGSWACSFSGALTFALNVAITLAVLSWSLVGACRGSWGVDEPFVRRWRRRLAVGSIVVGLFVFLLLPKVAVVVVQ
jgi:hypothetical protein